MLEVHENVKWKITRRPKVISAICALRSEQEKKTQIRPPNVQDYIRCEKKQNRVNVISEALQEILSISITKKLTNTRL